MVWNGAMVSKETCYKGLPSKTIFQGWAGMTFEGSGTGTGIENSIPKVREWEGNWKSPFPKFGNEKGIKKSNPKFWEREGNEKNPFPKFGNGKGMKKSIPKVRERESEASILGNDREREFPLTPGTCFWEPFYGNSSKLSQAPSSGRVSPTSRSSSLPSSPSLACSPGPVCGRTRRPWGDS